MSSHVTITLVLITLPRYHCIPPLGFYPRTVPKSIAARRTYSVWCPSSSEPEEEDEGMRDPNFKLHTASFSEVPKVCTEWRDPGDGLDAYQHVEDMDSESKRRYVEY